MKIWTRKVLAIQTCLVLERRMSDCPSAEVIFASATAVTHTLISRSAWQVNRAPSEKLLSVHTLGEVFDGDTNSHSRMR